MPWYCAATPTPLEVRVRPVGQAAAYEWSGRSGGACTDLAAVETASEALMCTPASTADGAEPVWLSVLTTSSPVPISHGEQQGTLHDDWTLELKAPLSVENALPFTLSFVVWQDDMCSTGSIGVGDHQDVYGVSPLSPTSLELHPALPGWSQPGGPQELSPGTMALSIRDPRGVDIRLRVDVVVESSEDARDAPMMVRVSVPCWVVNRTPYPLFVMRHSGKLPGKSDEEDIDSDDTEITAIRTNAETASSERVDPTAITIPGDDVGLVGTGSDVITGLRLRIAGSESTPPLSLESSDRPTVIHATLTGGQLVQVTLTMEPGLSGFRETMMVTVDAHLSITNGTSLDIQAQQAAVLDQPTRHILSPGDAGRAVLWEDARSPSEVCFRTNNGVWSSPVQLDGLMDAYVRVAGAKDGADALLHVARNSVAPGIDDVLLSEAFWPFAVANMTAEPVCVRPAGDIADWLTVPANASVGLAPQKHRREARPCVEVAAMDAGGLPGTPCVFTLEAGQSLPETLIRGVMTSASIHQLDGCTTLVLGEVHGCDGAQPSATVDGVEGNSDTDNAESDKMFSMEVEAVEVAVVDSVPMEAFTLSIDGVRFSSVTPAREQSLSQGAGCSVTQVSVHAIQLDDQRPFSEFPVMLYHKPVRTPLLSVYTVTSAVEAGVALQPLVSVTLSEETVRLAVHEPTMWRLLNTWKSLGLDRLSAAGERSAAADPQLAIDQLDLFTPNLNLSLSFRPSAAGRPKVGRIGGIGLTLANVKSMPFNVAGFVLRNLRVRQSQVIGMVLRRLRQQLFGQAIQMVRGVGYLDGASNALSNVSSALKSGSSWKSKSKREKQGQQDREASVAGSSGAEQRASSIQRGVFEGVKEVGGGAVAGVTGIFSKPYQMAKEEGVAGFAKGVGLGIGGAVAQPVAGALGLMSKGIEGVSAQLERTSKFVFGEHRPRRPALAVGGDGVVRGYSTYEAEGQQVLRLAQGDTLGMGGGFDVAGLFSTRAGCALDRYETHQRLPKDRIFLITDRTALLVQMPGPKANLLEEPCRVLWTVPWDYLLSTELAAPPSAPSGTRPCWIVLHLSEKSSTTKSIFQDKRDQRIVKCYPDSQQAQELRLVVEAQKQLAAHVRLAKGGA